MHRFSQYLVLAGGIAFSFFVQLPPALRSKPAAPQKVESTSSVSLNANGDRTVKIINVTYEITGQGIPGRPPAERLLLRQTVSSKQGLEDAGREATTILEAWPLGADLKQKPLYELKLQGVGGRIVDGSLFVADRRLEDVEWWSVYRLGSGEHLLDTHVPLVNFSISKDVVEARYIGFEAPADDSSRLQPANLVGVITYATPDRLKCEILLTHDDPHQAARLRSYADTTRTLTVGEERPPRAVRIVFQANDPGRPSAVIVNIPLVGDDLDLANAELPAGMRLAPFERARARH
jgi:hypothetical protein